MKHQPWFFHLDPAPDPPWICVSTALNSDPVQVELFFLMPFTAGTGASSLAQCEFHLTAIDALGFAVYQQVEPVEAALGNAMNFHINQSHKSFPVWQLTYGLQFSEALVTGMSNTEQCFSNTTEKHHFF